MIVTYLLILTGVVGYACWRGYQLEAWVGELSKSVGQLAGSVTNVELEQERQNNNGLPDRLCTVERRIYEHTARLDTLSKDFRDDRFQVRLDPYEVAAKIGALSGKVDKLESVSRKPRGKK